METVFQLNPSYLSQSHYKNQEKLLKRQTSNLQVQQAEYQYRLRTCSLCNGYRRVTELEQGSCSSSSSSRSSGREWNRREAFQPSSSFSRPRSVINQAPSTLSDSHSMCSFCSTSEIAIKDCIHIRHKEKRGRDGSFVGDGENGGSNMPDCQSILNYYNDLIDRGQTKIPW